MIDATALLSFLQLERGAGLILTDSGGVQEEAFILGVPCVTLRDNAGRPETVEVGANFVAGTRAEGILKAARSMSSAKRGWKHPFGDGRAAERIVETMRTQSM